MQNFPNNIVLTSLYYRKYYTMCRRLSMFFWRLSLTGQDADGMIGPANAEGCGRKAALYRPGISAPEQTMR